MMKTKRMNTKNAMRNVSLKTMCGCLLTFAIVPC
jgi:hypothetical protein